MHPTRWHRPTKQPTKTARFQQCRCSRPSHQKSSGETFTKGVSCRPGFTLLENLEVPQFTTLNADVIPHSELLAELETYQPKIDPHLIEELWRSVGLQTSDKRLLAVASAMVEQKLLQIIGEVKCVNTTVGPRQQNFSFEDLSKAMSEFGVALKRPPFIAEKAVQQKRPAMRPTKDD